MPYDRSAVVAAIGSTRTLDEAAHALGASRKTLFNRMRAYGLPRGKSGRPPRELHYVGGSTGGAVLGLAVAAGAAFVIGRWWSRRATTSDGRSPYLVGAEVLGSR